MKKKLIYLLTTLLLISSLASCQSSKKSTKESTKASTTDQTTDETSTKETKSEKDDSSITLSRGTQSITEYANKSVNIKFPLTNFGTIITEDQLQKLKSYSYSNSEVSKLYNEDQLNALDKGVTYDFMGYLPDGKSNVLIYYEDMTITAGKVISCQTYLNTVLQQLKAMGYEFEYTAKEVELAGQTFSMISGKYNGITQTYYCNTYGNYLYAIIVSTIDMNNIYEENFIKTVRSY